MGNVVDAITGRDVEKSAQKQSQYAMQRGLGELSPESIMQLIKALQSPMFSTLSSQIGGAQGAIRGIGGRSGMQGSGVLKQLQAGVPGQLANSALQSAIGSALPIALKRADIGGQAHPATRSGLGAAIDTGRNIFSSGGILGDK